MGTSAISHVHSYGFLDDVANDDKKIPTKNTQTELKSSFYVDGSSLFDHKNGGGNAIKMTTAWKGFSISPHTLTQFRVVPESHVDEASVKEHFSEIHIAFLWVCVGCRQVLLILFVVRMPFFWVFCWFKILLFEGIAELHVFLMQSTATIYFSICKINSMFFAWWAVVVVPSGPKDVNH